MASVPHQTEALLPHGDHNNPNHAEQAKISSSALVLAAGNHAQVTHTAGPTLLPSPIASLVSLATKSSSLYLSIGTYVAGLAIDGARVTTLTGLELSRAVVGTILTKAGRDVVVRSSSDLGQQEAEGVLERSIATLHSTLTKTSFLVSTGFHLSSATLSSASDLSLHFLSALDSVLGSTESSRAIASIITLIRREFQNPETGVKGERVGLVDLLIGISGLALLQKWCRATTDKEVRNRGGEQTVWDVVILNNGRRADVVGALPVTAGPRTSRKGRPCSFIGLQGQTESFDAIQQSDDVQSDPESPGFTGPLAIVDASSEARIRQHFKDQLPPNASVSITAETVTTKTVTVEITGAEPWNIEPPPGVQVLEESAHHRHDPVEGAISTLSDTQSAGQPPWYRVVYQTVNNSLRSTNMIPKEDPSQSNGTIQTQKLLSEPPASKVATEGLSSRTTTSAQDSVPFAQDPPYSPPPYQSLLDDGAVGSRKQESASSIVPLTKSVRTPAKGGYSANQKRHREAVSPPSSISGSEKPKSLLPKMTSKARQTPNEKTEKRGTLRRALQKGASNTNLTSIWNSSSNATATSKAKDQPPALQNKRQSNAATVSVSRKPQVKPPTTIPQAPQRGSPNFFSSRNLGSQPEPIRAPSRGSYYSIHERRRDSVVSQTDTYSIHSADPSRPASPNTLRNPVRTKSKLLRAQSEKTIDTSERSPMSPARSHRRTRSYIPSIYTLATNNSETSLILADKIRPGLLGDPAAIMSLHKSGLIDGLFPQSHLVRNISRYVRFASASYGSHFLRVMGISSNNTSTMVENDLSHHEEHHSFSRHTQLPPSTILLSSFVDPQGGSNSAGETNTGVPLVHYVSLDHESRAVVLTCRGTLGFEDVLTDMTCDYDELRWRGKYYKVHKGIHASARRLLSDGGGRVMATITAALEEFPEYGLVMCGHSLGGGVAAVLAILISEPNPVDPSVSAFVTVSQRPATPLLLTSGPEISSQAPAAMRLPSGRPVHVYAYGPPATISPSLRLATRGLITTVINNQDVVPSLSLGLLRDLQAVALAFKTDTSNAKGEVRNRVWAGLTSGLAGRAQGSTSIRPEEEDQWAYSALKSLRASMLAAKLMPPGEVFVVEAQPVLQRDAFTPGSSEPREGYATLGRPATRAVLKFVEDVENRFSMIRFGTSMLTDHSPGRYEASLGALAKGVLGDLA